MRVHEPQRRKKSLSPSGIEFITQCLKEGKPLPDSYRYKIPARGFTQFSILRLLPWQFHVIKYYKSQDDGVQCSPAVHLDGVQVVRRFKSSHPDVLQVVSFR